MDWPNGQQLAANRYSLETTSSKVHAARGREPLKTALVSGFAWICIVATAIGATIKFDDMDLLESAGMEVNVIGARTTTGISGPGSIQARRNNYLHELSSSKGKLPDASDWSAFVSKNSPFSQKGKGIEINMSPFEEGISLADIFPFKLQKQTIRAVRIEGEGGAQWLCMKHNQTQFVFITDKDFKAPPAQVISAGEVMVFSITSKPYLPLKSSSLTVSTPDNKYFNIEDSLWTEILNNAPVVKVDSLPAVNIQSSNVVNAKDNIHGTILKDLVLEVLSGASLDALWKKLDSNGKDFVGVIRTSLNGYQSVNVPSGISNSPDTYRVCIYCLFFESKHIGTHNKLFKPVLKDKKLVYEVNQAELADSVKKLLHSAPAIAVVDNQHALIQSHVLEVGSGQFLELAQSDLRLIVEMQRSANLNQVWFERVGASELLMEGNLLPLVVYDEFVFRLKSLKSPLKYVQDPNSEPALVKAGVSNQVDKLAAYYSGIDLTSKLLDQLWTWPGLDHKLFVSSCKHLPTRTWPYLVKKQSNTVQKYYLNLILVRPALKSAPVPGVTLTPVADKQLDQVLVELKGTSNSSLKVEPKSTEYLATKPVYLKDSQEKTPTPQCLEDLVGLKDSKLLSKYSDRVIHKVSADEREVYVKGQGFMVLNTTRLVELYEKNNPKSNADQDLVPRLCLQGGTRVVVKPVQPVEEAVKVIVVNKTTVAKGSCSGKYTKAISCAEGTFEGAILTCPDEVKADNEYNCTQQASRRDFKCSGNTTAEGCKGVYETTLVSSDGTTALKIKTSNNSNTTFNPESNASGNSSFERREKVKNNQSQAKFTCQQGSGQGGKQCNKAALENKITSDKGDSERVKAECEGTLDTQTYVCNKGQYKYQRCVQSAATNKTVEECQGYYNSRTCTNGGTPTQCYGETGVVVECFGEMQKGVCIPYELLPIIKVNSTHWLRGKCSSKISDNTCKGVFNSTDKFLSKCQGNPASVKADYDACISDKTLPFGSCQGVTNSTGCHGKYFQEVKVGSEDWEFKSSGKTAHFNWTHHLGQSKHIWKNPATSGADAEISKRLYCQKKVIPGVFDTCSNSSYFWFDDQDDFGKPGMQRRKDILCPGDGTFRYQTLGCIQSDKMTGIQCVGRASYTASPYSPEYSCLGNLTKVICNGGGKDNQTCLSGKPEDTKKQTCEDSYFVKHICAKDADIKGSSSPVKFSQFDYVMDVDGRKVKIAVFDVDSLGITGAQADNINISKVVSESLRLSSASQESDGSLSNIQFPRESKFVSFDEGRMESVSFQNFLFDNVAYRKLAVSDDCSYVKLKVKEMVINSTLFKSLQSQQGVFRKVIIQKSGAEQGKTIDKFGYKRLDSNLAFGSIYIRNAEIYLPYISNKTIDSWVKNTASAQQETVKVPDIGVSKHILVYSVNFAQNDDIYLMFPKFTLENMDLDLLFIDDWVLSNHKLDFVPGIGDQMLKTYQTDKRVESRLAAEATKTDL